MSCYIRQMTKEDIPQVAEIDREAFPTQWPPPNYQNELRNHMAFFSVVCDGEISTPPEAIKGDKKPEGLLARIKQFFSPDGSSENKPPSQHRGHIIGFIGSWIMADEAHITSIAVRETHRRRGIGEMLIIDAVELAMKMKADILTLEVRVSNTGAQNLYSKWGFVQVGLRKAYYTDNREDAIIMSTDKINSPAFQKRYQELKQAHAHRMSGANPKTSKDVG